MSREDVELVREACDAWASGDFVRAYASWHADIEWDTAHFEAWPEDSVYRGKDEVRRFLEEEWLGNWDLHEARVENVLDAGDHVVVFWSQRMVGRGSGAPAELKSAQVWTLRDGKVVRIDNYTDHAEAVEAAGLRDST